MTRVMRRDKDVGEKEGNRAKNARASEGEREQGG